MNFLPRSRRFGLTLFFVLVAVGITHGQGTPKPNPSSQNPAWNRENLVAWCIVPFDSQKRTPQQRAEMLQRLGIKRLAYDYRAEHIPTFDDEMVQLKKHGIELTAWWFPSQMNPEAELILEVLKRHQIQTQLWVTGGGNPTANEEEQRSRIESEANRIRPIAEAADKIGCKVGLYNHGGWFGDPDNQIALIQKLGMKNVGIVFNLHHAHADIDRLPGLLARMKPYLFALNLNGTVTDGERKGKKIVPIGAGDADPKIMQLLLDLQFEGPIGILNHTDHDAELRLLDNLDGLKWLLEHSGKPPVQSEEKSQEKPQERPKYRTWETEKKPVSLVIPQAPQQNNLATAEIDPKSKKLAEGAKQNGEPSRGAAIFASAKTACLSCHKIGRHGGAVGPDLSKIGTQRSADHLAQSLLLPNQEVEPKYKVVQVLTDSGETFRGFLVRDDAKEVVIQDPARGIESTIPKTEVERVAPAPSLMPEGLIGSLNEQQSADLVSFLTDLGHGKKFRPELLDSLLEHAQPHDPTPFPFVSEPRKPDAWPNHKAFINRDRLYEFYSKEATYFRESDNPSRLLAEYPGIDGGKFGHWGNQNEATWANGDWKNTLLGSTHSGVLHLPGKPPIPRAICVRLGEQGEMAVCFNPDTLTYDALWQGGFVEFSTVRHGLIDGMKPQGKLLDKPEGEKPKEPHQYLGMYRVGNRVLFAYRIGDQTYLDSPWVENGKMVRQRAILTEHPMRTALQGGPLQWPQAMETDIHLGSQSPYAIDTIDLPVENPWKALIYCGDHDFLEDGSALVCTIQGDVWRVTGLQEGSRKATWKRFASGLHQALGLRVSRDGIFVLGRDQLTRLHDLNHDGEADFYEAYSRAYTTSPSGHDYICGLQRDPEGNFYIASGNEGIVRIAADGKSAQTIAYGFRNPDGLGIYPDGLLTVPCSEGEWTPASMICGVRNTIPKEGSIPFFGYRGALSRGKPIEVPTLPMVYLPRGIDNSAGGQTYIDSNRWGPLAGNMIHTSFGTCNHFLLLRDNVGETVQGALIPLDGDFLSGIHRAKFSPKDGQLYVSGMAGWGNYATTSGCFQRVRYTGDRVQLPVGFHVHENGIVIRWSSPLSPEVATTKHFVQAWDYRYGAAYGSSEYSTQHRGVRGHDRLEIRSSHLLPDGSSLFLEIPELQPANQVHIQVVVEGKPVDLFATCNAMDKPYEGFPGYTAVNKTVRRSPVELDVQIATKRVANPWQKAIPEARTVRIQAGKNLSYDTPSIRAISDEPIQLVFANPDAVPHNWALIQPGKLASVGEAANLMVSDPEAFLRQYVPQTNDILCYTDIVDPGEETQIFFRTPKTPGRYPFLCTFPGHWMVMNGELVVE